MESQQDQIEQRAEQVREWLRQLAANARTVTDGHGEPLALKADEASAVLAECAALRGQQEWRDIASAPKDGSEILCTWVYALPDGGTYWAKVMHVLSWWPNWRGEGIGAWVLDGDFAVRFEPDDIHEPPPYANMDPTHWQPLPRPPAPAAQP